MIRSSRKLSPAQPSPGQSVQSSPAPSRSRLATVVGCSLSSPKPWDLGTLEQHHRRRATLLHLTLTALAVSQSQSVPSPVTVD